MDRKQENGFPVSTDSSGMHWHNGVTGNLQGTHRMCNIKVNSVRVTHQTHQKAKRSQDPLMGRGILKKNTQGNAKDYLRIMIKKSESFAHVRCLQDPLALAPCAGGPWTAACWRRQPSPPAQGTGGRDRPHAPGKGERWWEGVRVLFVFRKAVIRPLGSIQGYHRGMGFGNARALDCHADSKQDT